MQTTVKHGPNQIVVYAGFGDWAVEIGLFPWKWTRHSKRTQLARKKPRLTTEPAAATLPGFTEPEHPPQTSTALGK